ncbi:MAG: hypothetical protein IJT41_09995 [Clostridia bacterium]|nr:hypothetical protein [Clostridia bacterium]
MKCPKCGGEIALFDLKPNCKHCGVNIMYFTQQEGLMRDAKRTELEAGAARMVIARVKANFIGGKLQIVRLICTLLTAAALLLPFGGVQFSVPFFDWTYSAGILGIVGAVQNGFVQQIPAFLGSAPFFNAAVAVVVPTACLVVCAVLDLLLVGALLLGFLNLTRSTKFMCTVSVIGAAIALLSQIAELVLWRVIGADSMTRPTIGFGALAAMAMFLVVLFINRALLKKGIEPQYREFDPKRRELLKKVRAGEVDLDSLPLPIFESEEEREERMHALEEALIAEEEGKEA